MKKYLLIILLLATFLVRGQTPGTGFVTVNASWKGNTSTGQAVAYFGNGWYHWFVSTSRLKIQLDSISSAYGTLFSGKVDKVTGRQLSQRNYTPTDSTKLAGLFQPQCYEVVGVNGQTTYILPFTLQGASMIFYNGTNISVSLWSGINTTSITINGDIRTNDLIKIQK
jgi:hypothetical protein